eukprot:SAG22_NODE_7689_length_717_cov_0.836570_1_plen_139_part_10
MRLATVLHHCSLPFLGTLCCNSLCQFLQPHCSHTQRAVAIRWLNDATVMVPVEDLVWESHHAQADQHGAVPQVGQVGQEIYGAGLALDMALLQGKYRSSSSAVAADGAATLQLFPRMLRCGVAGGNVSLALEGAAASLL